MATAFRCAAEWIGDRSALLVVEGELDMVTAFDTRKALEDLDQRATADHLVVDLSGCTFIDSVGLSVLIAAQHRAESRVHIVADDPHIRRVFEVSGLDRVFALHRTREEALAAAPAGDPPRASGEAKDEATKDEAGDPGAGTE